MLQITINGEIHSSKNSRRVGRNKKTGKIFVSKSKSSKKDEGSFADQLAKQTQAWQGMMMGQTYPIKLVFYFRRQTKRKFDYVNLAQGLLDALVKAEFLPDDDADHVVPVFAPYVLDKKNPGCDLTIFPGNIE